MKNIKSRGKEAKFQNKLKELARIAQATLFDVCACKCSDFNEYSCEKSRKVPIKERHFLIDQRGSRMLFIGEVDKKETERLSENFNRKETEKQRIFRASQNISLATGIDLNHRDLDSEEDIACCSKKSEDDPDFNIKLASDGSTTSPSEQRSTSSQMRKNLKRFAETCDRFQVRDRAAAALSSALLRDLEIVTSENDQMIIDKNKVRRECAKRRKSLRNNDHTQALESMRGLFFDSRKDETLIEVIQEDCSIHQRSSRKEHISIVSEPGSQYFDHVTPSSGKAKDMAAEIWCSINKMLVNPNQIVAIGCDSTAANTGISGGVVRLLEKKLENQFTGLFAYYI